MPAEVRAAAERLAAAGVPSPRHDAEELAAHVLRVDRGRLPLVDAWNPQQRRRFDELVERRAARVPLQHLTGTVGFRRLELAVGPGVFVPRPETEVVVEWCLQALEDLGRPMVADLCAGSGAIGLAIAEEHPSAVVQLVERDPRAYAWLARNALGTSVRTHLADVADALPGLDGRFDLVVANPPYIPDGDREVLDPEVRDHDPDPALWGGPDGLDGVRLVERTACRLLRPGGLLAVEHADCHGAAAPALLRERGWLDVADHTDLAGRPRFVTAAKPEEDTCR